MSDMTPDEYNALRKGETSETEIKENKKLQAKQEFVDSMTTKAFLIARTNETIKVPLSLGDGTKDIEIRVRLSKAETKAQTGFLTQFHAAANGDKDAIEFLDTEEGDLVTASFMAQITIDPQLDTTFWNSDHIEPATIQEILIAYFTEPARRRVAIEKFRKEQLRAELCGDAE